MFLPDHEAINHYGKFLREMLHGAGIWVARSVLLGSVGLHIWAAWSLTRTNWQARPVPYRVVTPDASTYASRTMRWSGPILLLFIVYHLLHFTVGSVHPAFVEGDVYRNVIVGFSSWPVVVAYVIAMWRWACTCGTAPGACCRRSACRTPCGTAFETGPRPCSR